MVLESGATGVGTVAGVEQRISLVTLGSDDVGRARRFYEALGWRGQEVSETVFFQAGGMALVIWSRQALADDLGVDVSEIRASTLAHNVRQQQEVDALVARAAEVGATVTREPAPTFYGGYAGAFADPDGHLWEIAHNPGFPLADDGSLVVPDLSGG